MRSSTRNERPLAGHGNRFIKFFVLRETIFVLKGRNPQHLMDLEYKAERIGCCHFLVKDEDKTEVTRLILTLAGLHD